MPSQALLCVVLLFISVLRNGHGGGWGLRSRKQAIPPLSRRSHTLGTLSNMDDDLGDLSELMGEDYKHGGAEDEGDPNVKPKVC